MPEHPKRRQKEGRKLKAVRRSLSLSQTEMAAILKTTQSYISALEQGRKGIGGKILLSLLRYYSVNPDYFRVPNSPMFIRNTPKPVKHTPVNPISTQMNALQIYRYNGTPIEFEMIDGQLYANATEMCQAFGKRPAHWLELVTTKRYISALKVKSGIPTSLILTRKGNFGGGGSQGTWIHEKLILKLAQWLDVDFEIWCDERIAELLKTGKTQIQSMSVEEMIIAQAQSMIETKKKLAVIEQEQQQQRELLQEIDARTATRPNYFTVVGYAVYNRIQVGFKMASQLGQHAARLCKERGLPIDTVPDPRFGKVGSYPVEVLKEVFNSPIK